MAFLWALGRFRAPGPRWACRTPELKCFCLSVSVGAWRPRRATGWGRTPGLVANDNGLVEPCGGIRSQ